MEFTYEEEYRILDAMWEDHIRGSFGVCMICNVCGGSSSSSCECAKNNFTQGMIRSELRKYYERSNHSVVKNIKEDHRKKAEAQKQKEVAKQQEAQNKQDERERRVQAFNKVADQISFTPRSQSSSVVVQPTEGSIESQLQEIDRLLAEKVSARAALITQVSLLSAQIEKDERSRVEILNRHQANLKLQSAKIQEEMSKVEAMLNPPKPN